MNSLFSSDSALTVGNVFEALPALTSEYIASLGASDVWLDSGTDTSSPQSAQLENTIQRVAQEWA